MREIIWVTEHRTSDQVSNIDMFYGTLEQAIAHLGCWENAKAEAEAFDEEE